MEGAPESIPVVLGRDDDGRWWADIESMRGVMAYGPTREAAISAVLALLCGSSPTASITERKSRRNLALGEGEVTPAALVRNRLDYRLAKRVSSTKNLRQGYAVRSRDRRLPGVIRGSA